ncbi:MAG TPA: FAD-dependent oxidoreductase [Candidatus Limiplasma merdipullorum]|nr:FAD-dependent oxidoreductase [Candidatus Limiplasma merdipullorum]
MRTSKVFLSLLLVLALLVGLVPAVAETTLTDGTYTGTGKGMHSNIAVTVTVEDGAITSVTVDSQDETPGVSDPAFEQIPAAIVAAGNTDVDTVAGATLTSNGIIEAVNNALNGTTEETSTELTIEPDMIVVGSGMAGLVATARGVELGLNVLVLEQSVRTGGCIHYAGGTVSGAGFKIQKENGVEDTPEAFYADIEALGGEGEFNEALAKRHTEEAGAAIDWLDEDLGVDFGDRSLVGGAYTAMQTLRVTRALGSYSMGAANAYLDPLNERLEQAIADGKAQIMYNTKVTELLVEGDKCVGVKAGDLEFRAPSVVLATGGYSYNEDLLKMAGFENVISCAPSTSDGSGFLLAQAVGGVFDNMDEIVNYYGGGIPTNGFDMYYQVNNSYPGMIYVNAQGDRVGAEESATSAMWYGQEESKLYAVISSNMIDKEQAFIKHPMMNSAVLENNGWDKLEELAAEGNCVYKADTLEELAEMIGAENLTATVEAYNKDVAAGEDTAFGRSPESMVAFEEGPYYAVVTVPYVWSGTSGGVRANEDGYLQREDGSVITGLSLAGEILGPSNILGKINFGGINHSMCATWGIIAAENAAELAGK